MGYYRPLLRRPYYQDWPVIVGGWVGFLTAMLLGVTASMPSVGAPILVGIVTFLVTTFVVAFVRQRTTRFRT